MDVFKLSRNWFDWCFENPEKIKPTHTAMYFFIIEHCNRLWWKEKFWLPMEMTKDAIWISNYRTYAGTLNDLIEWGFIIEVQKSKNQYSSCIIAIAENTKAHTKALDKAMIKHKQKQHTKHCIDTVCIDIHNNIKQETSIQVIEPNEYELSIKYLKENRDKVYTQELEIPEYVKDTQEWHKFIWYWTEISKSWKIKAEWEKTFEIKKRFATWIGRKVETYQKESRVAKVY